MRLNRRDFVQRAASALADGGHGSGLLRRLPGEPLLSAGVIARRGDRLVFKEIDGHALRGNAAPSQRIGFNDPFRVASISKLVTATGVLLFASAHAADLDADVSELLGETLRHPAFPDTPITPRLLLSHRSGLRNGAGFPIPFNQSLMDRLRAATREQDYGGWFAPPAQSVGAWFGYSDVNFGVLAQAIERTTGQRFDHYMHDAVFAPMGLEIGYNWTRISQRKRDQAAAGARWLGSAWTAQVDASPPRAPAPALYRAGDDSASTEAEYRLGANGLAFAPHGGLRLSLADMDGLARMYANAGEFRGRRIIPAGALEAMSAPCWTFTPDAPNGATENGLYQSYGLGVQIPLGRGARDGGDAFFGPDSPDWRGHFGDAYGWMTGLFWNVRNRDTIVYAINGMGETDRPRGRRSALTAPEEALIDMALAAL